MGKGISHARWVWESWPCDTCGAPPGKPCWTYTGVVKSEPHAARTRLASEHHWHSPDEEGQDDGPQERA